MKVDLLMGEFKKQYEDDPCRFEDLPGLSPSWDPRRLVALLGLHRTSPDMDPEEMAAIVRTNPASVSRKLKAVDWDKLEARLQKLCSPKGKESCEDDKAENYRYRALAKSALKGDNKRVDVNAWLKELQEEILEYVAPVERQKPLVIAPHKTNGTPEHAVLLMSDAHVGLHFTKEETGGLNEYSLGIFQERARNLCKSVIDIVELHSKMYPIPELHVLCLGDMVQGSNLGGEWGPAYIREHVVDQVKYSADSISSCLATWSRMFKKVHFHGIIGNHGRAGINKSSDNFAANFDNIVYTIVEGRMALHPNVFVHNERSWWGRKDINGADFVYTHGDYFKGSNLANLSRAEKGIQALIGSKKDGKLFDVLCIGHFHTFAEQETSQGQVIVNGSFIGGDIHSMSHLALTSRPTQTIMGVHPKNGVTWTYHLDMDIPRE